MQNQFPSLITPDAQAGLTLARTLADLLHAQMDQASANVERPGGMNYLSPAPVPKEIIASMLFYTIASANHGWQDKGLT